MKTINNMNIFHSVYFINHMKIIPSYENQFNHDYYDCDSCQIA